ncbi:MAG: beta-galactosidase, partial [Alicyclobacillus sp.]|nr:beta-galactosidase [Alicyclobacillus sp.]
MSGGHQMISIENRHFVIDGQKTFLYGAECHYFRVRPEDWADRLGKIKEA